ncbi:hypothetical protein DOTSEDRAFT_69382 [Dothistroma septosporum NZE10]|uniref:Uncharacterized protein n=1 Tax=Dothistroma septosporum (strain NZE10 / CBS 128990) TaxID=675120 RepID=N1PYF7_DOTSN|nr:hypothetical protein DOTSEDRAFT_69382 [Dothistroma septosporum NZE10]
MSRSNDAGHFFQTTDALATTERKAAKAKNKHGSPIKLSSKVLAIIPGPTGSVLVAEAAGEVKKVTLDSEKIERQFNSSTAPLTCLAVDPSSDTVFAGSWDKTIYAINKRDGSAKQLQSHTDFVKCLIVAHLDGQPILMSGSSDATIIVWDIAPNNFGNVLHKLKGHAKALQDFAVDPHDDARSSDSITLFSASSDREIRRWHISRTSAYELPESLEKPILAHDTSVYKLCFDSDGDLWTASADKTAKHLVRSRNWEADTTLEHPDFVRDVVPFEDLGLVVTACRDEEVRVSDTSSGKLVCTYSGHFEEVTGLAALGDREVVSVSIDGTVRQWSLERAAMAKYHEDLVAAANSGAEGEKDEKKGSTLTAEEEAELAELMSDED